MHLVQRLPYWPLLRLAKSLWLTFHFPRIPHSDTHLIRLLACSGPQRLHPDLTCWETSWLPAGLCTQWSFLGSRMEEGSSVLPECPAGVLLMVQWDLGYQTLEVVLDPEQTVIVLSSLLFSHNTGIQMSLILHLFRVLFQNATTPCQELSVWWFTRKKTYVISSPQEELIQSFEINGCLKLGGPLMSMNSRTSLLFLTF